MVAVYRERDRKGESREVEGEKIRENTKEEQRGIER